MRRALALFLLLSFSSILAFAQTDIIGTRRIDGMDFPGRISRDTNGIINILAFNRHDMYFLNGYAHAHDRLFQMDFLRRAASGTAAEMVGQAGLSNDVSLRTLGLRRAAEASLPAYSERARGVLEAYAAGVNAYLHDNPALPSEYQALEITRIDPWTPIDSLAIGKLLAWDSSFDSFDTTATIALRTYQGVGQSVGFNGTALFFEDLFRSAPFANASTVPDSRGQSDFDFEAAGRTEPAYLQGMEKALAHIHPATLELARKYLAELNSVEGFLEQYGFSKPEAGSNEWGIAGRHTGSGRSMMANDPHLGLTTPATFYPIVMRGGRISVAGHSFAGAPGVIVGHNNRIAWGATVSNFDVTDFYQEQVVPVQQAPAGLGVMINGQTEWLFPIVQTFRRNVIGDGTPDNIVTVPAGGAIPPATLIVSRRNAPIVQLDAATGFGLSVQFTGLGATRELETFLMWAEAEDLDDFVAGLQRFDFGSQNFSYVDVDGNIAHFTSGEIPLRADLEAGQLIGADPNFIRSGAGGNEWIRENPSGDHSIPYRILPFEQMPQTVNPAAGWFVNANNDPAGTTLDNNPLNETRPGGGIYYLARWYANGLRAARITEMIRNELQNNGKITFEEMKAMQADVVMLDAKFFVPYILDAFRNAQSAAAPPPLAVFAVNPMIVEAVSRLQAWDFSTPTGIAEGYDASDVNGALSPPSDTEIANSVAATIYSIWRSRFIANTIDPVIATFNAQVPSGFPGPPGDFALSALRNLLENYSTRGGAGVSGINFFNVPNVPNNAQTAPLRRDLLILSSLADGVARLAGDNFKAAFNNSTNMGDYRWGRLHRIVFSHQLGGPFNIPPAGGAFPHPLGTDLPGVPVDGGYEVVDASGHNVRAVTPAQFMFGSGPVRRFVAEGRSEGIGAETSLPGGPSGRLGSPLYFNLLKPWLTNEYYPSVLLRAINIPFLRD